MLMCMCRTFVSKLISCYTLGIVCIFRVTCHVMFKTCKIWMDAHNFVYLRAMSKAATVQ